MKEVFLQYVWKNGLFDHNNMRTVTGERVEIVSLGTCNTDSGPDFFNAHIRIGGVLWVGNVEIHVRSGDWFRHNHHKDRAYDNVILNVVDFYDKPVFNSHGKEVLSCVLKYSHNLVREYEVLSGNRRFLYCFDRLSAEDLFSFKFWLQSLVIERLERKSETILRSFARNMNSWEETMYQLVARYFGMNVNAEAFEELACSLPLRVLARQKKSAFQIEALLLGQSGLLFSPDPDTYQDSLIKEYDFLKKKYSLEPIDPCVWKFMRTRPYNFPTIRIAQFAHFVWNSESLFSKVLEMDSLADIRGLFDTSASVYWDTHFDFSKFSQRKTKKMGRSTLDIIIINAIVPMIFAYGDYNNMYKFKEKAVDLLESIKAERNYITKKWEGKGVRLASAADSQALIQLKSEYCDKKRCLHCEIGNKIMLCANVCSKF